ncbi:MAG: Na+/H+ antiporter NhaA [Candidatus Odinarchaeum yellowstonii]|uniref:Na+/H+ antiporter NhaA n=1 Tax=Odinarchaeota yellowstonii (strain LCB_4) TaxID=1841599 RepID=A0AAF0IBQ4_ODILC|nr:MAG: Na+/H+ antiporter NhaA [Candidatus Odinarchaeum yellowstonii]
MSERKKSVLFISTFNSARSQIAEALLNNLYGDFYEAYSAGLKPTDIHPLAVKVMNEIGIDISGKKPKSIDEFAGSMIFDYVVTLCDEDFEVCPYFPGGKNYIHKSIDASFQLEGKSELYIADFRRMRDEIKSFIINTFKPEVAAGKPIREVLELRKIPDKFLKYLRKVEPIERISAPFRRFIELESSSGILLISCIVVALLLSNVLGYLYLDVWELEISLSVYVFTVTKPLRLWFNEGLMALFFLLVGLELKREFLVGELTTMKKIALPAFAALGGMIFPIIIYSALNMGGVGEPGWGIPMATDIAIVLGVATLIGRGIPDSLKVFLASFAIIDDIGAVIAIALFYPSELYLPAFIVIAVFTASLVAVNYLGAKNMILYFVLGVGLWFGFLESGVEPALAGLILALTIPAKRALGSTEFLDVCYASIEELEKSVPISKREIDAERDMTVNVIDKACDMTVPLLVRIQQIIHPWVGFLIIPLFILANTGVDLWGLDLGFILTQPVTLGVVAGLFLGKQIGITLFSYISVKTKLASLPSGVGWRHIYGAALLGGIGFTMSLFISHLAFTASALLDMAKIGILLGSLISGLAGWIYFKLIAKVK